MVINPSKHDLRVKRQLRGPDSLYINIATFHAVEDALQDEFRMVLSSLVGALFPDQIHGSVLTVC